LTQWPRNWSTRYSRS